MQGERAEEFGRRWCDTHQRMEDHDEETKNELVKITAQLGIIRWLAATMFIAVIGSFSLVLAISYRSGELVQSVKANTESLRELKLELKHAHKK